MQLPANHLADVEGGGQGAVPQGSGHGKGGGRPARGQAGAPAGGQGGVGALAVLLQLGTGRSSLEQLEGTGGSSWEQLEGAGGKSWSWRSPDNDGCCSQGGGRGRGGGGALGALATCGTHMEAFDFSMCSFCPKYVWICP